MRVEVLRNQPGSVSIRMLVRKKRSRTDNALELPLGTLDAPGKSPTPAPKRRPHRDFEAELASFKEFGTPTQRTTIEPGTIPGLRHTVPVYANEFWTARQRQAHSLHEISYRACFKPQLPRFFIERLTSPNDRVYDPFMGRGTTVLEAALLERRAAGCDANPLSLRLCGPRLNPPTLAEVESRLAKIDFMRGEKYSDDLLVFYHPETLVQITSLRRYFRERRAGKTFDSIDAWIEMVAINRLTGHSAGFFSVYTLPPNQATSARAQKRINERRNQTPPVRNVAAIIRKKSKQLLQEIPDHLHTHASSTLLINASCHHTPQLESGSVQLVVTSPPFLDVVDYSGDNWLRCWFADIDVTGVKLTVVKKIEAWATAMTAVFRELHRVLVLGGHIAFEVGEVHGGKTRLEETVLACATEAGLSPVLVMINDQEFTKTANCWGVDNNERGTNTNRIVLLRK